MAKVKITGWGTFGALGNDVGGIDPRLLAQSLNRVAGKGRTEVTRVAARVTGLPYGRVLRIERVEKATAARLSYTIAATDRHTTLADFKPRETRVGVSAAPWGSRRTFEGSFMMGGQFPHRVPAKGLAGQIFKRVGDDRLPIAMLYGPSIPEELLKGEPKSTWQRVAYNLRPDVLAEVKRRLKVMDGQR